MAPPPRRALIAVTSAHAPLYPDGKETGVFISEALHPFQAFRSAGFEVDLISETGAHTPDWLSLQKDFLPDDDRRIYEDQSSEFRSKLDSLLKPGDVKPSDYGLLFFSAGHASLIDYPTATGLHAIASSIYTVNGGIVAAVCHGGAAFPSIIDPTTSRSIIAGKKVTGFTTLAEEQEGIIDVIKRWGTETIEASAGRAEAVYVSPPGPWDNFVVVDGRVVTGANPASAGSTAKKCVEVFGAL
ncbi:class I glutamine amidotransferase-like protein [Lepidopterella palustris CBS 459.81]|uniref:D-lactate dehydratase n=1 Tax=Lepidopterella palustris CBS 459.81 TaxID=1314670 RepID=A0A8E2E2H9_9PEZI|nr:class I glutamine amidotransferase-like protein [Lepidopterella palustris CBS 459.81]